MTYVNLPSLAPPSLGNCYETAARVFLDRGVMGSLQRGVLVHGYPVNSRSADGARMGHAWLEFQVAREIGLVYDAAHAKWLLRKDYYILGQLSRNHVRRFSLQETLAHLNETETWGPWGDIPEGALFAPSSEVEG